MQAWKIQQETKKKVISARLEGGGDLGAGQGSFAELSAPNRTWRLDKAANYTAYGIRGGLIRVIHRHSDAMGLLRGHSHNPQDLAFLAGTDVLASVAGDGNLFVWKLQRADSGEISPEEVFHATWEAKASA